MTYITAAILLILSAFVGGILFQLYISRRVGGYRGINIPDALNVLRQRLDEIWFERRLQAADEGSNDYDKLRLARYKEEIECADWHDLEEVEVMNAMRHEKHQNRVIRGYLHMAEKSRRNHPGETIQATRWSTSESSFLDSDTAPSLAKFPFDGVPAREAKLEDVEKKEDYDWDGWKYSIFEKRQAVVNHAALKAGMFVPYEEALIAIDIYGTKDIPEGYLEVLDWEKRKRDSTPRLKDVQFK